MSSEHSSDVKFEIGHVLFIDIVGYSKLLITEQSEQIQTLKQIVRGTEQVRLAEAEGKLLRLPTGDGGALVFRTNPEAPVLCALEIGKELKNHPELRVRMGIHSGPVNEVVDLNEQANIAGAGINIAQRVMDCGDAGHILVSKHVADDLEHYPRWQPHLHALSECEVKHGVRLSLFNLYTDDTGNRRLPSKLASDAKQRRWRMTMIGAAAIVAIAGAIGLLVFHKVSPNVVGTIGSILQKSVAVLPFENLSDDKSNAYFAEGIQDEILTKLASIADLKVISRTSTAKYKSKPEDLKIVSQQLGVATLVEGTVQRLADKVRVNVQLIDARADSHLWAKTYDRDIKDVFAVESEVSQEIAEALQAKLSTKEANRLAAAPTQNAEAYDLFLKAEYEQHAAESSLSGQGFDRAAGLYEQAVARDPGFVLAIAGLVKSRVLRHHFGDSLSEAEVEELRKSADRAVELAPDLAEAHIAQGLFYYYGVFQYDRALGEFQRALVLQPNNLEALAYVATIHNRQGLWATSLAEYKKCEELDPRRALTANRIASSYLELRMWEEARRAALHSLALDPHNVGAMHTVFFSHLCGSGDVAEAKRVLETFPPETGPTGYIPGGFISVVGLNSYLSIVKRDFKGALKTWENERSDPVVHRIRLVARTVIHLLAGEPGEAAEIDEARQLLEAKIRDQPDDVDSILHLAWINLALKRNAETLKLAKEAVARVPMKTDAIAGSFVLGTVAELQAQSGKAAEAIKSLQTLLSMPAGANASIQRLKIDPVWDPIRNDSAFQQLLAGKELVGPNK